MHNPNSSVDFDELIQTAIREGKQGRAEIVRQLCALPLERLAKVPPSALAIIGPEGLAAISARRAEFAGLDPAPAATVIHNPAPAMPVPPCSARRWWLSPTAWLCIGIVLAALSFDRVSAMIYSPGSASSLSRNASNWPRCPRLDSVTDGCVYRTGGNRLTLTRAASLLQMDAGDLAAFNRHLTEDRNKSLPAGSSIIVLRDVNRLIGRNS